MNPTDTTTLAEIIQIETAFKKKLYKMLQRGNIDGWAMDRLRLSEDPVLQKIYDLVEGNLRQAA